MGQLGVVFTYIPYLFEEVSLMFSGSDDNIGGGVVMFAVHPP